jgi:AbrB family looped-hinge helix DNA binding protein
MSQATVTSKGQITIPKEVRDELGIETGTRVMFVRTPMGYLLKPRTVNLMDLRGALKYDGPPLSDEEIERRVGEALAEKYRP